MKWHAYLYYKFLCQVFENLELRIKFANYIPVLEQLSSGQLKVFVNKQCILNAYNCPYDTNTGEIFNLGKFRSVMVSKLSNAGLWPYY